MKQEIPDFPTHRPVNIAYLTSCRELGLDEKVGQIIIDPVNGHQYGYREGNLEHLVSLLQKGGDKFSKYFNLTAVIVDDNDSQYARTWLAPLWPQDTEVPLRDVDHHVIARPTLENLTFRIPSQPWKDLRRDTMQGESQEAFMARKAMAKSEYERQILRVLERQEVDLVLSDSYVTIIGSTLLDAYRGRILNIHPAVTQVGDPDRLPGLTPTRDAYTRAVHGYIIIDDKKAVDHPTGEVIEVVYDDRKRTAVRVQPSNVTGVTVHIMNEQVDNGPIVRCYKYQFFVEGITPEAIRTMNYRLKREILPASFLDYVGQCRKTMEFRNEAMGR